MTCKTKSKIVVPVPGPEQLTSQERDPAIAGSEFQVRWPKLRTGRTCQRAWLSWKNLTLEGTTAMNWDQIQGHWKQLKGNVQSKWGELTDDEVDQIEGDREALEGKIQQKYGKTKEEAKKEVDDFLSSI